MTVVIRRPIVATQRGTRIACGRSHPGCRAEYRHAGLEVAHLYSGARPDPRGEGTPTAGATPMTHQAPTRGPRPRPAVPGASGGIGPRIDPRVVRSVPLLAAVSLGLAFLSSPQLARPVNTYVVGEFATRSIRAPDAVSVVDEEATALQRTRAAAQAPLVVLVDRTVPASVLRRATAGLAAVQQSVDQQGTTGPAADPTVGRSRGRRRLGRRPRGARPSTRRSPSWSGRPAPPCPPT